MSASVSSDFAPDARVRHLRDRVNEALPALVEGRTPEALYEPVRYVLSGGGKRLRPVLLLLVADAYGADVDDALPAALAVEVFHNFTLVHDDIMDEAPERRGRPTVHTRWDTGTAILTGDLLMGLSYKLLSRLDARTARAAHAVYHPMVEKLCAGQALDADFETRRNVSVEEYLSMIDGKTGALIATVFELGGVVGGASDGDCDALRAAGQHVGRAFQIQDDLLDLTADHDEWGKAVGGDLMVGKKTFLTLRTLELADGDDRRWFGRLLTDGGLPADDVPEARERMAALGVFDEARDAVARYTDAARARLACLPDTSASATIHDLLDTMEARTH